MKWEVPVVYKGQVNFIIEAPDEFKAAEIARQRFMEGEKGNTLGNEWEELDYVGEVQEIKQ